MITHAAFLRASTSLVALAAVIAASGAVAQSQPRRPAAPRRRPASRAAGRAARRNRLANLAYRRCDIDFITLCHDLDALTPAEVADAKRASCVVTGFFVFNAGRRPKVG